MKKGREKKKLFVYVCVLHDPTIEKNLQASFHPKNVFDRYEMMMIARDDHNHDIIYGSIIQDLLVKTEESFFSMVHAPSFSNKINLF